ncbi:MAG: hypothetical protein ACRD1U_01470 [Vicinamibacterales bacterium]
MTTRFLLAALTVLCTLPFAAGPYARQAAPAAAATTEEVKRPIGGAVVFDTNELLQLFPPLRVVRYEDTNAVADFGLAETRVVRLAAVKP